jgi:DNA replication protein DnaC
MTAFLKIDCCQSCRQDTPWDFVPPIMIGSKPLVGTGVWRTQLLDGRCPACVAASEADRTREREDRALRLRLIELLGGTKPQREFTFERYRPDPGNTVALQAAKQFDPSRDNLYLWGRTGVGKTHLAYAIAGERLQHRDTVAVLRASGLTRKLRMRTPDEEQQGIDQFVRVSVLVLDEMGIGTETAYSKQVLQEILDGRDFNDRGGLIVTSMYSPFGLATRWSDNSIPSRLAAMCRVIEVRGLDHRRGDRPA